MKQDKYIFYRLFLSFLFLCTGNSCSSTKKEMEFQTAYDAMMADSLPTEVALEQEQRAKFEEKQLPISVQNALLPKDALVRPELLPPRERRFDIVVDKASARDFFQSLATDDSRINMVVHPDLKGEISVELHNVTVWETVETVCEMYSFDCQPFSSGGRDGLRGYKIFPNTRLMTQTFMVDFLPITRTGTTQTKVSSGQGTTSSQSSSSGGVQSTSTTSQSSGTDVSTGYDSDVWKELEMTLASFLSVGEAVDEGGSGGSAISGHGVGETTHGTSSTGNSTTPDLMTGIGSVLKLAPGRHLMINKQAGIIVVRAAPEEIQDIRRFLNDLKFRSRRQVILETKVIEVELSDGFQFGVDWLAVNKGLGSNRFEPLSSEPNKSETFLGMNGTEWTQGLIFSKAENNPISMAFREHDFIGFINLLKQQGNVEVLSSPRVATINNQKAVIKVGSDEIFMTDVDMKTDTNATSGTSNRTVDPVFTTFFSGVALDVTPQVGDDGWITLHVHPTVNEVTDKIKTFTMGGETQSYPLAFNSSREADSIIRVRDGEVAVIGGLMKREVNNNKEGLPGLSDLPMFGMLFRHDQKNWKKSELVILLRPVIVEEGSGSWNNVVSETAERVRKMHGESPMWWAN
ncbi:MAG: pilus (MSHA type) biogenesis protein MshL [Magnetococcus sp. DMHC-6]